jgi:peptidoglycan hydrolase-like protein with peptidoglycan-binding domain
METLAYLHITNFYDASEVSEPFCKRRDLNWTRLSSRISLSALSVLISLGVLTTGNYAFAQYVQTRGSVQPACGYPQVGDAGAEVHSIQQQLNNRGYSVGIDGVFGDETEQAVRRFQAANGLSVDGCVGPATRQALFGGASASVDSVPSSSYLKRGDVGGDVSQLQRQLQHLGYYNGAISGVFDTETENALRRFQADNGLVSDGVVGSDTRAKLSRNLAARGGSNSSSPLSGGSSSAIAKRYVVVIPTASGATLSQVRRYAPSAFQAISPKGNYFNAGSYSDLEAAEAQSRRLRNAGLDARVSYQ